MYDITVDLVPGLPQIPFRNGVGAYEGVVAHATSNYQPVGAPNERAWMAQNYEDAFVHFFVDWNMILQTASTDYKAYGAGPKANPRFLHIELCQVRNDGSPEASARFTESYNRYVWLLAYLLFKRELGVSSATLWSHKRVSNELGGTNHEDPDDYLAEWSKTWDNVINDVTYLYNAFTTPPVDIRKLKADEIRNEVEYMFTLLPQGDGESEWALNYFEQVYDIMLEKNLVREIKH
ncbi:peptidoglycan recognition protein family protein [Paenibacillus cremeus]|uniref:N-acetylmuramoyl-L-alanine amidase n=1 Tax=Paenibacillus cremeus TaxID=2163881 RepID=A0A559JZR5_9BACL|nr:peptidoglycan recognition family protein [Paenibacillus cremeus]TVY05379.1 N-acetylmuramoyl-L-alanine amidase [Paenibacillus cremeus]